MISTRGRYALRVMVDLAMHQDTGLVPLKVIASRQEMSKKYLESILHDLVEHEFVSGVSGRNGGYRLMGQPEDYTAYEVLRAVRETLAPVACLQCDAPKCTREAICPTLGMWKEYEKVSRQFFQGYTIRDLMNSVPGSILLQSESLASENLEG